MLQAYAMPGLKIRPKMVDQSKIDRITKLVCGYYGQELNKVKSKSRKRELVLCRQVTTHFLRIETPLSWSELGALFGGRDHTTAIHSVGVIKDLLFSNEAIRRDIDILGELINRKVYLNLEDSFV